MLELYFQIFHTYYRQSTANKIGVSQNYTVLVLVFGGVESQKNVTRGKLHCLRGSYCPGETSLTDRLH